MKKVRQPRCRVMSSVLEVNSYQPNALNMQFFVNSGSPPNISQYVARDNVSEIITVQIIRIVFFFFISCLVSLFSLSIPDQVFS